VLMGDHVVATDGRLQLLDKHKPHVNGERA
jgi:hypothetical protein